MVSKSQRVLGFQRVSEGLTESQGGFFRISIDALFGDPAREGGLGG